MEKEKKQTLQFASKGCKLLSEWIESFSFSSDFIKQREETFPLKLSFAINRPKGQYFKLPRGKIKTSQEVCCNICVNIFGVVFYYWQVMKRSLYLKAVIQYYVFLNFLLKFYFFPQTSSKFWLFWHLPSQRCRQPGFRHLHPGYKTGDSKELDNLTLSMFGGVID